jgi:hypothetical protein
MLRTMAGLLAAACLHANAATNYERLADSFGKASAPTHADIKGYWAGRCTSIDDQATLTPAILVQKIIQDPSTVPPNRPSLSYFTQSGDPALFDNMTPAQIEEEPAIKDWFAREQWQATYVADGSIVNLYRVSETTVVQRALRKYNDEFNKMLVLRVTHHEALKPPVISRYCYFSKFLGSDITPPEGLNFGSTGPIADKLVRLDNPTPDIQVEGVRILNGDGDIDIVNTQMTMMDGTIQRWPAKLRIRPGRGLLLHLMFHKPFYVKTIQFEVEGSTSNLEIKGVPH